MHDAVHPRFGPSTTVFGLVMFAGIKQIGRGAPATRF